MFLLFELKYQISNVSILAMALSYFVELRPTLPGPSCVVFSWETLFFFSFKKPGLLLLYLSGIGTL